jgi:ankyrin repeat protein
MTTTRISINFLCMTAALLGGCALATSSTHRTEEYTPVFAAADDCDLPKVRRAIEKDPAMLKATSWDDTTLLHEAVGHNCQELVTYLVDQGEDANARTSSGMTPLHMAARRGDIVIASVLLQHGADINAVASKGTTPLDEAKLWDHQQMVAFLTERGAR